MSREKNKKIAEYVLDVSKSLDKERFGSYYSNDVLLKLKDLSEVRIGSSKSVLEVCNNDVVDVVIKEAGVSEDKVCVLNFASAKNAGGGFLNGASAQEESLCRASDLYLYLKNVNEFYKNPKHHKNGLYDSDLIYSKDVSFLCDSSGNLLPNSLEVDVITCAAVNLSDIKNKKQSNLLSLVDKEMIERIENIIQVAVKNDVDVLVLGAFGCGVFGNNGYKVRGYFEKVLNQPRFKNRFKKVIFSVYKDANLYNIFKGIRV